MICMSTHIYRMIVTLYHRRMLYYISCKMSQPDIPILSKTKVKAPPKRPDPKSFAQCRISLEEYEACRYVAQRCYESGALKTPKLTSLFKAALITTVNRYFIMEQHNKEVLDAEKKRLELQAMTGPSRVHLLQKTNLSQYLKF
jgi:hypothetical protein